MDKRFVADLFRYGRCHQDGLRLHRPRSTTSIRPKMIKIARTLAAVAALVAASAGTASAQFTVYTNRTAFETALGSFYVDDFNTGSISTVGATVASSVGSFGSGVWNDRVVRGGAQTTWSFVGGTAGFGGEWDLTPGGAGQGIEFTVNWLAGGSATLATEIPNTYSGQFFGFITTGAMMDVIVNGGTQGGSAETHNFDNMTTGTSTVPEPSTYALMAVGLGMVGVFARRRRV